MGGVSPACCAQGGEAAWEAGAEVLQRRHGDEHRRGEGRGRARARRRDRGSRGCRAAGRPRHLLEAERGPQRGVEVGAGGGAGLEVEHVVGGDLGAVPGLQVGVVLLGDVAGICHGNTG